MKTPEFVKTRDKVIDLKLRVMDKLIEDMIEPIADVGNPEKLIGKPYEQWTPQDLTLLTQIYGAEEPNPLSDLIFKKEYDSLKKLEEEE